MTGFNKRWVVNGGKAAVVLAVLAGLSACGASSEPTAAEPTQAAAPSESAAQSQSPAESTGESTGESSAPDSAAGAPDCTAGDIEATLTEQPQRREGDTRMALLHLKNVSGHVCHVDGSPVIALVNAADETVDVPTKDVPQPGDALPIDLNPDGGAFAGIKWTICGKDSSDCPTGNTIKVGLEKGGPLVPATLEGFPDPERSGITVKSLQVGTIQPSNQGVVAW
ncbi:DUF4232 domain-containing protein [Nonomuraea maritima]|uniref:DUF4232 domain-containing protein n=1 Tax=Nonomuraea maritima TaxID=683260 RepID=UPI003715F52F